MLAHPDTNAAIHGLDSAAMDGVGLIQSFNPEARGACRSDSRNQDGFTGELGLNMGSSSRAILL